MFYPVENLESARTFWYDSRTFKARENVAKAAGLQILRGGFVVEERDIADLWAEATQLIRLEMSDLSFDTWIKDLRAVILLDNSLILETPNAFNKQFLIERYQNLIAGAVSRAVRRNVGVEILLPAEVEEFLRGKGDGKGGGGRGGPLNPKYTFESFVVGSSNRFAHAAALASAELPGEAYNPLFIYGGVGLGKTHLMHAIGHFILARNPRANVLYVSSETFTNELISAIRTNKNQEFREKFRKVDVLMIDDIQFIGGKEQTQEEFFHTFNTLHENRKQIVISSDKQPKEIASLEDRLRSRFEWGLIADIQKPDLETRIAILRRKAEQEKYLVPEEVNALIAGKVESNIRELEGCLTRVCAYAELASLPVTLELAEAALVVVLPPGPDPRQIAPETIVAVVCEFYGANRADLIGQKRNREIVLPRQIAMYMMRTLIDMSLPAIGAYFGGRDHTTVLHACSKIEREIREDRRLATAVTDIRKRLLEE